MAALAQLDPASPHRILPGLRLGFLPYPREQDPLVGALGPEQAQGRLGRRPQAIQPTRDRLFLDLPEPPDGSQYRQGQRLDEQSLCGRVR